MFLGIYWNWPVCPSMHSSMYPSVYKILVILCLELLLAFCSVEKALIFHIVFIPCGKIISLVPLSKSSVNVKVRYHGHNLKQIAVSRTLVVHKHVLLKCLD